MRALQMARALFIFHFGRVLLVVNEAVDVITLWLLSLKHT
jgi:hypothetical protein